MTKLAVCFLLLGASLFATPVLNPDSQRVPDNDPGLGRLVIATPGYFYEVWWNDNVDQGDYDFNDLVIEVQFAQSVINGNLAATAKIKGSNTANHLVSYTPGGAAIDQSWVAFSMPVGQEAIFSMRDHTENEVWFTGPKARNSDNDFHAWVSAIDSGTLASVSSPEPQTIFLAASGVGLVILFGRKKSRS